MQNKIIEKEKTFFFDLLGIKIERYNIIHEYGNNHERKDCSTRALTKLLEIPYKEVLKLQHNTAYDMEETHCESSIVVNHILHTNGYVDITPTGYISVGEFMYNHKSGKYFIIADGHAVAYIDGVMYDNDNNLKYPDKFLTCRLFSAHQLKKKEGVD